MAMSVRIGPASAPYSDNVTEDLVKVMPPGMEPLGLFLTLGKNPRLLRRLRRGGLLDAGSLCLRQRELVILRTTALSRAEYEWGVHVAIFAAAAGFDDAARYATVWLDSTAPCWAPEEALLVRACDELHASSTLGDGLFADLRARFSEEQTLEILMLNGFYRMVSQLVRGTGVALEPFAPRFPPREAGPAVAITHAGSCLCGSVRYEVDGDLGDFGYCHCRSCRKASGSAHAANAPVERVRFRLRSGADSLREYESSPGKLRVFCGGCGSPIYAYLESSRETLRLRLGSLDTQFSKQPRAHTFVSDKAAWEPINDTLPAFSEWASKAVLDQPGTRQAVHAR
jgi:hypothetical protein